MEQGLSGHVKTSPPPSGMGAGGGLAVAVDRLDRALASLESRVRALRSGDPLPVYESPDDSVRQDDYQRLRDELDEVRATHAELAAAAETAFTALGAAAADIRLLLGEEAD